MRAPDANHPEIRRWCDDLEVALASQRSGLWSRVDDEVWCEVISARLVEQLGALVVRVPSLSDPDAALYALAQIIGAESLGAPSSRAESIAASERHLLNHKRPIVVVLDLRTHDAHANPSPTRADFDTIMERWARLPGVWLAPHRAPPAWLGGRQRDLTLRLPLAAWREHLSAALEPFSDDDAVSLAPTEVSAAHALVTLGHVDTARLALQRGELLRPAFTAASIDDTSLNKEHFFSLSCIAAQRMPLPRAQLLSRGVSAELYDAMTWETSAGSIAPRSLRSWARKEEAIPPAAHDALAAAHRALDGQCAPPRAGDALSHWLNKLNYLAHGSAQSTAEWDAQSHPAPEFYWNRGRRLSLDGDYRGAVAIYERCIDRFQSDAYSRHYHAFNLERAGMHREDAEADYRAAITLDPGNPWFHGRLVTFLLRLSRLAKAREAWSDALRRVGEGASAPHDELWLGENLHRWVAQAWLLLGDPREAQRVLDDLDPEVVERSAPLRALGHDIEHAVEVDGLGDVVYPPSVSMRERWRSPRVLPDRTEDEQVREAWWPGRVLRAGPAAVTVVLADPHDRTLLDQEFNAAEWSAAAGTRPESAAGFFELGRYGDRWRIVPVPMSDDDRRAVELPEPTYLRPTT